MFILFLFFVFILLVIRCFDPNQLSFFVQVFSCIFLSLFGFLCRLCFQASLSIGCYCHLTNPLYQILKGTTKSWVLWQLTTVQNVGKYVTTYFCLLIYSFLNNHYGTMSTSELRISKYKINIVKVFKETQYTCVCEGPYGYKDFLSYWS